MADLPLAKKSLGQHWLEDQDSLEAIIDAADITLEDTVLEIGPGTGTLTKELIQRAKQVIAVEVDEQLVGNLKQSLKADNLTIIQQDILKFDVTKLPKGYKVVANIPYYLTSNLLRTLCESLNPFSKAAILMQQEVAERVCARPGDMSLLSISVQLYCEASLGRVVPANLFIPPPKVDSQVLQLTFRSAPLFQDLDTKLFFRIVKAGFSQRRKTITNSLGAGLQLLKPDSERLLIAAGVQPTARAQDLALADWYRVYTAYLSINT